MNWRKVTGLDRVGSPTLLVDPDLVRQNIAEMITIVGGEQAVGRLRPHVKTHKISEVVRLQLDAGITNFKAATVVEAAMVAAVARDVDSAAGTVSVLLAHQPVGPKIDAVADLTKAFPGIRFAVCLDSPSVVVAIEQRPCFAETPLDVWIDVDCGMRRTGIPLGEELDKLRDQIGQSPSLTFAGLHVYDGHLHDSDIDVRRDQVQRIIEDVSAYDQRCPSPSIVAGGSPTFAIWARETAWQCSPGTTLFWDAGYQNAFAELPFQIAAVLLTRVVSDLGGGRVCLDLGHKAVAAEMPLDQRVRFPTLPDVDFISHSEEHLVIQVGSESPLKVGDELIAMPTHICPTVALHNTVRLVKDGAATTTTWNVTARDRTWDHR